MKNKIKFALVLLVFSLLLVSCGKKSEVNENGCFISMDAASENAKKNKQDILLIVTTGEDDIASKAFVDNVLAAPDFKKEIASKYSTVNFDFSEASYQKTVVKEDATADEQKAAETYADLMYKNARVASMLNVQAAPAVYLFTKEKYFITEIVFDNDVANVGEFAEMVAQWSDLSTSVNEMVRATEKGTVSERVQAIDTLFEATDTGYKVFLSDLIDKVIELDKKNESGYLSKYILAKANSKASDFFLDGKTTEAVLCFVEAAKQQYVEPIHVQQLYYMAAYILAMSGSTDYKTMLEYLQSSIDAAPDSETVTGIQMFKSYIEANTAQ